jgi:hypothetical protein
MFFGSLFTLSKAVNLVHLLVAILVGKEWVTLGWKLFIIKDLKQCMHM